MSTDSVSGLFYHEETDLSFFVEGLGRTTTAMVGTASWGPMNEPTLVAEEDDFKEDFGPPVANSNTYMAARSYFQRGNSLEVVRVGDTTVLEASATPAVTGAGTAPTFKAKYKGTFGDNISLEITAGTLGAGYYKITVTVSGIEMEVWDNLPEAAITDLSTYIAESDYITSVVGTGVATVDVPQTAVPLTGGDDGIAAIADTDYIGSSGVVKTGLQLLKPQGEVDADLIVCPNTQSLDATVYQEMIDIAEGREDLLAVLDSPAGLTVNTDGSGSYGIDQFWRGTSAHAQTLAVNTSFAVTYWNWVTMTDYFNSVDVSIPPGAACAGAINYSDRIAYEWWAPAGIQRGNVSPIVKGTEYQPIDSEITILQSDNTMGCVNPILLIDDNYYIMGQKTMLRNTSMLKRINTRRLICKLKKTLVEKTSVLQGEPNDETAWREFEQLVKPYLDYVVNRRGLISYEIQVGLDESMDANDIGAGRLIGRVVLVLMPTAEKVILQYVITDQGASFSEIGLL